VELRWERIENTGTSHFGEETITRAEVPGGWLVRAEVDYNDSASISIAFYPDPEHNWM
jgi:hypothetical protein